MGKGGRGRAAGICRRGARGGEREKGGKKGGKKRKKKKMINTRSGGDGAALRERARHREGLRGAEACWAEPGRAEPGAVPTRAAAALPIPLPIPLRSRPRSRPAAQLLLPSHGNRPFWEVTSRPPQPIGGPAFKSAPPFPAFWRPGPGRAPAAGRGGRDGAGAARARLGSAQLGSARLGSEQNAPSCTLLPRRPGTRLPPTRRASPPRPCCRSRVVGCPPPSPTEPPSASKRGHGRAAPPARHSTARHGGPTCS